jgi:glycosyltransferase involved in cell wall biosynthesis
VKIAVYAIAKNEAQFVARFCESAKDADLIFVADTGSTDDTVAKILAEKKGHDYHRYEVRQISIKPWRFDDARNAALAMLPDDIDVCVSLDLDEVLQPGWRAEIERVWTEGTTRLRYGFDWGCGIAFKYEKIHARYGYRWKNPCHEYPVPDMRLHERWADTDMLMVVHQPDSTKSRGQYLDLLKVSIEEDPLDPRNAFYYARELSFHSMWEAAIAQCERYLALPRATWANERCYAMRVIGRCWRELGEHEQALAWFRRATSEAPHTREPWCELAKECYLTHRWAESLGAALTCLAISHREFLYTVDPEVWGWLPHDWASIAAWNLELYQLSYEHAKKAVELAPSDLRLRQNLEFARQKVA